MKGLLTNFGMLLGILLAVAGLAAILLTGFEPLYAALSAAVAAGGGGLAYFCNKASGGGKPSQAVERSRQAPVATAAKSHPLDMKKRL